MQHIYKTNCASKLWRHCRFFFALVILSCFAIASKAQTVTVSTTTDVVDGNTANIASLIATPGGAGISLREAVIAANNEPAGATVTINIPAGTFTLTIPGAESAAASGDLDVNAPASGNKTITVNGVDSTSTILTSTAGERIFEIHAAVAAGSITFNLNRCRLQNATMATGSGGAILAGRPGDATNITDCSFWNNTAINGGAISQSSGAATHSLTITNCSFMYNSGTGAGGAVNYNGLGTVSITNTKFIGNSISAAGGNGGALNLSGGGAGGTYTVSKNTFISNRALNPSASGGAISNVNGVATVQYNRFIGNNAASGTGNAIYQTGGSAANTINANDNWWGVNTGPAANDLGAGVAPVTVPVATTWLQLRLSASPTTICSAAPGNTTTVTGGFTANSAGTPVAAANLTALVGLPIAFTPTNGTLSGAQPTIQSNGNATVVFTGTGGAGSVSGVVDNVPAGTASVAITVTTATSINGGGQPANQNLCNSTTATFTVSASGASLTYQWYRGATPLNNGASGTGSTYAGATSATLTITNADADDVGNNYNVIVTGACGSVTSNNASLSVATSPTINSVTPTQPGCGTPTGTIVINATGTGTLEYSVDNGGSWQVSNTFAGLAPGNYNIRVRSQSAPFCEAVYVSNPVVINAGSVAPTVNAPTVTQPTCAVPTGTIVVNATGGSGTLEYSVNNGGSWQLSNTFAGLSPGNYNIIVRNQTSPSCFTAYASNPVVINAVPAGPTVNAPTVTQPTCAVPTGTIVVNATGSGTLEYSVNNGGNWFTSNSFTGLTPGNYTVLVRLQASPTCVTAYASNPVVINAVPVAPTVNAPTVTQPSCASPSGTIVVNATGAGTLEYSIDNGGSWQVSNTFTGLTPGNYNIRVRLQSSPTCFTTYASNPVVINPSPLPTVTNPGNQVVCHNSSTAAVTFTGSGVPSTTYNWTNNNTSIGLAASGTDVIPSFTATNAGTTPVTATITVTPTAGACTGTPITFTITVNPRPTVNAVSNQALCATQSTTAITFSGSVPGTVYSWTNNNTSIGLAANGTGNIAAFPTVNPGPGQQVATITVTPSYTNAGQTCTGTPVTFTITVNPRPTITVAPNGVCGPILLTASGADTYTWSPATGLSATTGASVTASPTSTTTYTVTGTITATGCQNTGTVQVLGTPPPIVITPAAPAICAGQFVALNAPGSSTITFTSTNGSVTIPGTGTGASTGSGASIYPVPLTVAGLPAGATVKSITINGITHTFPDDIDVLAQSPTGTNVVLMSDAGGGGDITNNNYTFDDAAAAAMADGAINASGTYKPTNLETTDTWPAPGPGSVTQATPTLASFTGDLNGQWKLFVSDDANGDAGSMTTWSITFNIPTIQWSPATGLFLNAAGTIPYTPGTFANTVYASPAGTTVYTVTSTSGSCSASPANVTVTVNPLPTISVTPNNQCSPVTLTASGNSDTYAWSPATGLSATTGASVTATTPSTTVYTVTGTITATGCTNTATATVLGTPSPIVVSPANPTLCAGSFLPLTVPQTSTVTVNSTPGVITIPATGTTGVAGPYPAVINVSGLPTSGVIVKSVTINGVTHTFPDDLDILLQSPTGTNVVLMSDAGGGDDITNRNYTFDDAAAATMADGAINAAGTYKPTSFDTPDTWPAPGPGAITQATPTLASFTGNPNGNWNLYINDDGSGDVGTINSWSITFAVSTVQWSPATGLFLDAAGTIPYVAGTNANTVYASPANTTTYNLTSTLGTCSATPASVTVTVNPVPTVTVSPTGQCSPVTLTAAGNANTYSWSPATGLSATTGTTVVATPTVNTTYTVTGTITATGCTKTATAVVNATPPAPLIAPTSATICFGNSVALTSLVPNNPTFTSSGTITVPGTGTTGVGSPYPSTITVSGLPATGVTVQSVTLNGVTHTFAGDLDVLLQSPTGTNVVVMSDANGINSISNVNYVFRDDAAASMTTSLNPSGTYKPTNLVGGTGVEPDAWAAPGPGTITQPNPTLSSFTGDPNGQWKLFTVDDFTLDAGSIQSWSITFNVVGGVFWSPATGLYTDPATTIPYVAGTLANVVYAKPTTTTTYAATVSTPTCTSPPTNVTVTVVQPIAITTQPTAQTVCAGVTANFSVAATGNAITYQWQVNTGSGFNNIPGATNASLAVANTTTAMSGYQYRVILQNGCFAVTSNTVTLTVNAIPVVAVTPLTNRICVSDTLVALSGTPAGGVWSGVGVSGNTFIPVNTAVGTYTLTYTFTNPAGCSSSATTTAKVESCPERMILLTDNAVILWPNPNNGQFNVRINSTLYNYLGMDVYNVQGQLLYKQQWSGLRFNRVIPIDLKHLPGGVYMVKFFYDDGVRTSEKTFKVIVAR